MPIVTRSGRELLEQPPRPRPMAATEQVGAEGVEPYRNSDEDEAVPMINALRPLSRSASRISVASSVSSGRSVRSALRDVDREARRRRIQLEAELQLLEIDRERERDRVLEENGLSDDEDLLPPHNNQQQRSLQYSDNQHRLTTPSNKEHPLSNKETEDPIMRIADAMTKVVQSINAPKSKSSDEVRVMFARQSARKDLPEFTGLPEEWPMFISQLRRTTELCQFSDEENISRLQKALKGKAFTAVQAMLVTGGSLHDVLQTLEMRFGQPEHIMRTLVRKVQAVASPSEERMESFADFAVAVKNLTVTAETLKMPEYLLNPQLMEELVQKLPNMMRLEWGNHIVDTNMENANLVGFSKWLERKAAGAMKVAVDVGKSRHQDARQLQNRRNDRMFAIVENDSTCSLGCGVKHALDKCEEFQNMDLRSRWNYVKRNRLCFCCLRGGHSSKDCRKKKECSFPGCGKTNHHYLLHIDNQQKDEEEKPPHPEGFFGHSLDSKSSEVILKVVPVTLRGPKNIVQTYALLDDGSTGTIMEEALASELELEGEVFIHSSSWLDGKSKKQTSSRVSVTISGSTEEEYVLTNVKTRKDLCLPSTTLKVSKIRKKWRYLHGIPISELQNAKPRILIGSDNCFLLTSIKTVEGPLDGPVATLTRLGWVLHGPVNKYRGMVDNDQMFFNNEDDDLHEIVKAQFRLDAIGIQPNINVPKSKEDARAEQLMDKFTRRTGDAFETCLLWKDDNVQLPSSRTAAERRLKLLEKKMDEDPDYGKRYCAKIEEYVEKGFARKVSSTELLQSSKAEWFIPHFGRVNPNKPAKLRLLLDCKGKVNGTSLNDALLQGPDLLTPLISVLAKFRQREVAFSGDIRDMFHMVKVRKEDTPALRFLWRGKDRRNPPDVYEMNVLVFGAVSSPYQAQWVKNKNAEQFRGEFPDDTIDAITNRHYVDDYLDSVETVEEAIKKIEDIKEVHRRGGFEIRGFLSNKPEVTDAINPVESKEDVNNGQIVEHVAIGADESLERVLGLYWDHKKDVFRFKKRFRTVDNAVIDGDRPPTKREVLKLLMCIFDPLGFLGHLSIRGKILLQDIWRSGIDWDDKLPDYLNQKWKCFMRQLEELDKVEIPRCYSPNISQAEDIQLHVFCDASEQACCCSSYLRVTSGGIITANIVMSKTRVAPLKPQSIPRLELEAALMGSRMSRWIQENHDVKPNSIYIWTDSRNVLCWLRSSDPRRFRPFIAHRIGEILELTEASSWRWIPTLENVADDGTRDQVAADLTKSSRFFTGPAFLNLPESEWPKEEKKIFANVEELELKKDLNLLQTEELPELNLRLTWDELKMEVARKLKPDKPNITAEDLIAAETQLLIQCQQQAFLEDLSSLQQNKKVPKSSRLIQLSPFLDTNGIMRMRSRIALSPDVNVEAKYPIILDPKHDITKKIIDHYHVLFKHQGQEMIVNEILQRFWVLKIRTAVRSAWRRCEQCQKENAKPAQVPMAPLPDFRVSKVDRPFTNTGVDHFGPIEVVVKRSREKRYGLVFTCLNTRAVHIEVAHSLDTDSTLQAIERFISRRGVPAVMWSDNGRSFVGANGAMKKEMEEIKNDELLTKLARKGIAWKFIPPLAPHFGGAWERMVRCIKKTMNAVLKDRYLNDEMLLTVMAETEATVNSRPLSFVSKDDADVEAITPNSFLIGTTSVLRPPGNLSEDIITHKRRWKMTQLYCEHIWRRWIKEVLPTLAVRQKWNEEKREVVVGDNVLIVDGNLPRNSWITGVVTNVIRGNDGYVRVADVTTKFGIYRRPVVKLCPIIVERATECDGNRVPSREGA